MDKLIEELKSWGADTDSGIHRVMDDVSFYHSLVVRFASFAEFAQLEKALNEGSWTEAFRLAHSLKGASANLSLTPLYLAVSDLTEDLRKYAVPKMPKEAELRQRNTLEDQKDNRDDQENSLSDENPDGRKRMETVVSDAHLDRFRRERDSLRVLVADVSVSGGK